MAAAYDKAATMTKERILMRAVRSKAMPMAPGVQQGSPCDVPDSSLYALQPRQPGWKRALQRETDRNPQADTRTVDRRIFTLRGLHRTHRSACRRALYEQFAVAQESPEHRSRRAEA